jgi:hypothetical protein
VSEPKGFDVRASEPEFVLGWYGPEYRGLLIEGPRSAADQPTAR